MLSEDIFYEKEYEDEKAKILNAAYSTYNNIVDGRIFLDHPIDLSTCKPVNHASIVCDMIDNFESCNEAAVLGTIYYMLVYDYPNYAPIFRNKTLKMRAYNELFTRIFVNINCIQEWLNLYASLRNITSVLELPPGLRTGAALVYLRKLQEKGLLDESYRFNPIVKKCAFKFLIAHDLYLRVGCTYSDLENHFKETNFRDSRPLDAFKNKMSEHTADQREVELYNTIEDIFGFSQ